MGSILLSNIELKECTNALPYRRYKSTSTMLFNIRSMSEIDVLPTSKIGSYIEKEEVNNLTWKRVIGNEW